jgi:hypothetical protein
MAKSPPKNFLNEILVYNDGDLIWRERGISRFDKQFANKKAGSLHSKGYWVVRFNKFGPVMAHLIVWNMHNGDIPEGMDIDHIDGNKLNNKLENLRLATRSENFYNVGLKKNNTSGAKGVCWNKQNQNWRVRVHIDKKVIEIGSFEDFEMAALVASEFRAKHHREFAHD